MAVSGRLVAKPVIAVDCDEVLCQLLLALNQRYLADGGKSLLHHDFAYTYNLGQIWDVPFEESMQRVTEFINRYSEEIEPVKGAMEVLGDLSLKYDLVVVTARPRGTEKATEKWIDFYYPGIFKSVNYTHIDDVSGHHELSKAEVCKELGAKILIDDNVHTWPRYQAAGVDVLLFGNYPWNKEVKLPDYVVRARDWGEVGELLL